MAATAAVLLLLGLGRAAGSLDQTGSLTATAVGHDTVVAGLAVGVRVAADHPGSRVPAMTAVVAGGSTPIAAGARESTDGARRSLAPHLVSSTGDRAPPALP